MYRVALLFGSITLLLLSACSTDKNREHHSTPESLIKATGHIVVARLVDEQKHEVPASWPAAEKVKPREETFRRFEVVDSLMGEAPRDGTIFVVGDQVPVRQGQDYVLFLRWFHRPDGYPEQYGARVWTTRGEPSTAELGGQQLRFLATDHYRQAEKSRGFPVETSAATFALDMPMLTHLITRARLGRAGPHKVSGPETMGETVFIADRTVVLSPDAYISHYISEVLCAVGVKCPETPIYVLQRGESTIGVSARTGEITTEEIGPNDKSTFEFLRKALQ